MWPSSVMRDLLFSFTKRDAWFSFEISVVVNMIFKKQEVETLKIDRYDTKFVPLFSRFSTSGFLRSNDNTCRILVKM